MMGFSAHVGYHGLKSIANPIKLVSISPPTHSTHPFLYPLSSLASYLYLFFPHIHQISLSTNSASTTPFLSTSPIYSFSPSIFSLNFFFANYTLVFSFLCIYTLPSSTLPTCFILHPPSHPLLHPCTLVECLPCSTTTYYTHLHVTPTIPSPNNSSYAHSYFPSVLKLYPI